MVRLVSLGIGETLRGRRAPGSIRRALPHALIPFKLGIAEEGYFHQTKLRNRSLGEGGDVLGADEISASAIERNVDAG